MRYNIADIIVDMDVRYPRLRRQSEAYIYTGEKDTEVVIRLSNEYLSEKLLENPHLDLEMVEYIWIGSEFYNSLVNFKGMLLHSSCVVYEDKAYLFSAPCGTGKSTHTQLWLRNFPGAYILNDDKPAIIIKDDGVYACGTPFSGKTNLNVNKIVPIGGICILERDETNHIEILDSDDALYNILNQTVRPYGEQAMEQMLHTLDIVLNKTPVYRLYCNTDNDAPRIAYEGMNK